MDGTNGSPDRRSIDEGNQTYLRAQRQTIRNGTSPVLRRTSVDGGSNSDRVTMLDVQSSNEESSDSDDSTLYSVGKLHAHQRQSGKPTMYSRLASPPVKIAPTHTNDAFPNVSRSISPSISPHSPSAKRSPTRCAAATQKPRPQRRTALMKAARQNDVAAIDRLIKEKTVNQNFSDDIDSDELSSVDVNEADEKGYTALHHAALNGSGRALLDLLKLGAKADLLTDDGATALMVAAKKGHGVAVEILLEHASGSASEFVSDVSDSESLSLSLFDKPNLYRYESRARQYKEIGESERQKQLCQAVHQQDLGSAARMIAAGGIDVDYQDDLDITLLGYAVRYSDVAIIRLLLCAGASVNGIDQAKTSPLMYAVLAQKPEAISVLCTAGASTNQQRADGESALTASLRIDSPEILQALLGSKIAVWHHEKGEKPLLTLAVQFNSSNIAMQLLKRGADLPDKDGSRALAILAQNGNAKAVQFLLQAGADPTQQAYDKHTALTLAAANGHLPVVHTLLAHCVKTASANPNKAMREMLSQADIKGRTALMLASLNGHTNVVDFLLRQGADIHVCDVDGLNSLLWAVAKANSAMVNLLSNYRATHLLFDKHGNSGIMIAAAYGNLATLKVLLSPVFANSLYHVNTPNKKKETALTVAAAHGHKEVVRELLLAKANVLHVNAAGRSAKLEAVAHGHAAIVPMLEQAEQALLESAKSTNGILAAIARLPLIGPALPQFSSVKIPEVDLEGNSALALAARYGHMDMVDKLVSADIDALEFSLTNSPALGKPSIWNGNDTDNEDDTADGSLINGWQKLADSRAADIEQQNSKGLTPLCLAIAHGRDDVARLLVERGALVNHASRSRSTPLWLAASMPAYKSGTTANNESDIGSANQNALVDLLIDHGADVNMPSTRDEMPLHAAAALGRLTVVKTLLRHNANIAARDRHGLSPLGHAALHGHTSLVEYLIGQGATVHGTDGAHAPLGLAAANGHDEVISVLMQHDARVDHIDAEGRTALLLAAKFGKTTTVSLLLKLGANLHYTCKGGLTALKHAIKAGHNDIIALLQAGHPAPRDH